MTSKPIPSILVVDDEESVRTVLTKMLSKQGFTVENAGNVDEALTILRGGRFDVLLTDHMMEGRTGLDLIIDSETIDQDMVKILLTGFGDRDLYRDVINKGAVFSVIEKPSDSKQLIETIKRAVEFREKRVREKEDIENLRAQYHTLFEKTTDLIQCVDVRGDIIYVNPAWHYVFGYTAEELPGMQLSEIIHPDYLEQFITFIDALWTGIQVGQFVVIGITKDKRQVYLEGSASVVAGDNEFQTATFILRDVTERRRATEEIKNRLRQETMIAKIAALLATVDEPIDVYKDILSIIGETLRAGRVSVFAIDEVDSKFSLIAGWVCQNAPLTSKIIKSIPISKAPWTYSYIARGEIVLIENSNEIPESDKVLYHDMVINSAIVIPITISTCAVGVLGIDMQSTHHWEQPEINMLKAAADIIANAWTRQIEIEVRRQKEQEAEHSRLLVIRADRLAALGTMAAGIIHEITQPLNVINVSAQTILYGKERGWTLESDQVTKSLNLIVEQIKRMNDIITNMRAFTRDGSPSPRKKDNLNAQVERVHTLIGEQLKAHDIMVEFDFEDIPDVSMNTHQILQVILNLMTNARQALDDLDIEEKKILVRTHANSDDVTLEVSDNGPGISEELREKIFDPFFTTKEVGKGTGLGLSISMGIITDHQGKLLVDTNEMGGATFKVVLPMDKE